MSDSQHYYYLKLKDNFFDRPEIKAIESLENGYEYICIIQKMYLRSLSREGKLMLTDTIPYDLTTLSKVLGHLQETVKMAIEIFLKFDLCVILDDKSIYMTEIQNFIGSSSSEADRKRAFYNKIEEHKLLSKAEKSLRNIIEISTITKDRDIDRVKDIDNSIKNRQMPFDKSACKFFKISNGLPHLWCKGSKEMNGMTYFHCPADFKQCSLWFNEFKKNVVEKLITKMGEGAEAIVKDKQKFYPIFTNQLKDYLQSPDGVSKKLKDFRNKEIKR